MGRHITALLAFSLALGGCSMPGAHGVRVADDPAVHVPVPCEPGDVAWGASFEDACGLGARVRRPVLLVEVFGHLDEALC